MIDTGNTAWLLTATALVLFMTLPGLGLFYAGLVQTKNVLSALMQCIAIACLASVVWFAVAYSLAFAEGSPWLGGLAKALLNRSATVDLATSLGFEAYAQAQTITSEDHAEGVRAFLEKRPPTFTGA